MRKVLFVCTANLQRSPTAESLFQGWEGIWAAKSAGIMPDPQGKPLTQDLIDWSDLIIVMEPIHSQYIHSHFQCSPDKIRILNIADRYFRNDPELISILQMKVPPILEKGALAESEPNRRQSRRYCNAFRVQVLIETSHFKAFWNEIDR